MRVLISNDDGIEAPGIKALEAALLSLGEVTVVAPDRDRSGASNSLTLDMPIRISKLDERHIRVAGTPTDCVHLALSALLDFTPDIVVSGINNSANMGDDTLYSGTVAAAMEGRFLGLPAVAVSLCSKNHRGVHYASAGEAARRVVQRLRQEPLPADTLLNINVPDLPWSEIKGFAVTRLGQRHRSEPSIGQTDPRGRPIYWIGPAGPESDGGPGTDFDAVRRGFVSITPITVDLTKLSAMESVRSWVGTL
jgi:5'-nucleotidase